jgi:hypothetical protein
MNVSCVANITVQLREPHLHSVTLQRYLLLDFLEKRVYKLLREQGFHAAHWF